MVNVDKYTSPMEPVAYRIPLYLSIFHHQFGLPPNFKMPSFSKTRMHSAFPHFTALWRAVSPPQPPAETSNWLPAARNSEIQTLIPGNSGATRNTGNNTGNFHRNWAGNHPTFWFVLWKSTHLIQSNRNINRVISSSEYYHFKMKNCYFRLWFQTHSQAT